MLRHDPGLRHPDLDVALPRIGGLSRAVHLQERLAMPLLFIAYLVDRNAFLEVYLDSPPLNALRRRLHPLVVGPKVSRIE